MIIVLLVIILFIIVGVAIFIYINKSSSKKKNNMVAVFAPGSIENNTTWHNENMDSDEFNKYYFN